MAVSPFIWWDLPIHLERASLMFRIVAGVSPFAIIYLWQGMWQYWLAIDESNSDRKKLWFVLLLLLFWIGSILYCLFVYLPQVYGERSNLNEASR
jgi:hypothetical protein